VDRIVGTTRCDIAIVVGSMHVGGAERVTLALARSINSTGRAVWFIVTNDATTTAWSSAFADASAGVLSLPTFCDRLNRERAITAFISRARPTHLILSNTHVAYRALPMVRARCPNLMVIDVLHGEGSPQYTSPAEYSAPFRRYIDKRVAVSEQVRSLLLDRGQEDASRVVVIHNSVDVDQFHQSARRIARLERSGPVDELVVVFLGRLSDEKRPLILLKVADEMRRRGHTSCRFVVAGHGVLADAVRSRLQALDLGPSLTFHEGEVDPVEILADADVLVLPSTTEGFGLVLIEAMAASTVPIATCVGGIPEVIEHGESGLLVANDQDPDVVARRVVRGLEDLLLTPGKLTRMQKAARIRAAAMFSEPRMIAKYHDVLRLRQHLAADHEGGPLTDR
jgi:glycosyltransferase involved in cell wall biosynthesis